MLPTGQLGTSKSQLGNIVFGGPNLNPLPFGFTPHVLDSVTICVLFNEPVGQSALNPDAYSMLSISGPVPTFIPTVTSVSFYDADQLSVALVVNYPLTYSAVYSLSIIGVTSLYGNNGVTSNAGNFRANVPNGPISIGAYLSLRGMIDIYFDRSVGQTSPGASATIQATVGGTQVSLTLIPWNNSILQNVVRFELNPSMDTASSYLIIFSNVVDISNNQSSGELPLTFLTRSSQPYNYSILSFPQIIDSWVNSISNVPGSGTALINVFFNCPMFTADITNLSNWVITSNGTPVTIISINNWCSVINNTVFPSIDADTYFAQVEVVATTSTSPYTISVTARSEDQAYSTNPSNYTGNITVAPLSTPPRVVGDLVTTSTANFRLNHSISLPNFDTLTVTGDASALFRTVVITSSLQALVLMITDLMKSYNQHITTPYGAGHLTPDVTNYFLPTEFPGPSIALSINAINRFRSIYLSHASSTIYHHYADPNLVTTPDAIDLSSAIELAQLLMNSFTSHNLNVGVHNFAGYQLFSSKLYDTLSMNLDMTNGAVYNVSANSQYYYIDIGEKSSPSRFSIQYPFTGLATPPYVASAIPKIGLISAGQDLRFEQDQILVFFSKPIQQVNLLYSDILISNIQIWSADSTSIQITVSTSTTFVSGQTVIISGVNGTVEANDTWVITPIDSFNFVLNGSVFVNAYSGGGSVQQMSITIIGPSNIKIQGFEWVDERTLSLGVMNMSTAQYSLEVFNVQDTSGNLIASAP